jgi:hypothetical protein
MEPCINTTITELLTGQSHVSYPPTGLIEAFPQRLKFLVLAKTGESESLNSTNSNI